MTVRLEYAAASDVGCIRSQNEDSFLAGAGLFAVCDGMGGARAGEVASEAACRALLALPTEPVDADRLGDAIAEANASIFARGLAEPALRGMGTTMTTALAGDHSLLIGHVGDSRAYLWHEGGLRQVTQDHSLVGEMVRSGQLSPEQAAVHPYRSVITRALGTESSVLPDIFELAVEPGDRLLLCSDGLSGMLSFADIGRLLGESATPTDAADALVAGAIEAGGEDNVTVVVVFVRPGDPDQGDQAITGAEARTQTRVGPETRGPTPARSERLRGALPQAWGSAGVGGWLRHRRVWMSFVAVVVVLGLGVAGFALFNSTVYFVGAANDQVVLYRGMPYSVVGIDLYQPVETGTIAYSTLGAYLKTRVDSHDLVTKEEGQNFLRGLGAGG